MIHTKFQKGDAQTIKPKSLWGRRGLGRTQALSSLSSLRNSLSLLSSFSFHDMGIIQDLTHEVVVGLNDVVLVKRFP